MTAEIVNLRRARKRRDRDARSEGTLRTMREANGVSAAMRERDRRERDAAGRRLDGAKRDAPADESGG